MGAGGRLGVSRMWIYHPFTGLSRTWIYPPFAVNGFGRVANELVWLIQLPDIFTLHVLGHLVLCLIQAV